MVEAGGQGRGLAEVSPQADELDPAVLLLKASENRPGRIGASVVDEDDLERPAGLFHRPYELPMEFLQVLGLVENGDDKGDIGPLGGFHCGQYITKEKRRQQREKGALDLARCTRVLSSEHPPAQCSASTA